MAGPTTTMGHLRDGRTGGEPGSHLADGQSTDAGETVQQRLAGTPRTCCLSSAIFSVTRAMIRVRERQLARSRHLAHCTICRHRFPLLMVKAPGGLPSSLSLIFIFKMKYRLAGTLEPAKERSFVKPNVCDAGGAKDLPFDRIGASSL